MQENLESELFCLISATWLEDPITVPCCGRSFSRESLVTWFDHNDHTCPTCRADIRDYDPNTAPKNITIANLVEIAKQVEKSNEDGIVAINTVKAMKIDLDLKMPVLANKIGGYSGKAIKPIGIRCVYEISKEVDLPVIGVGGITTGEDAIEYFMAGASAVQIGSSIYYRGIGAFKDICNEIEKWMKDNGYKNISELIGVAHS